MSLRIRAVNDLLEPCEAKVSSTVLRGGGGSDTSSLPGLETGKERTYPLKTFQEDGYLRCPTTLSPDGKILAGITHDKGELILWDAITGRVTHRLKPSDAPYTALAYHPDGRSLLVGDEKHTIRVFDPDTGRELRAFGLPDGNVVVRMDVSPDGRWLVTGGGQKNDNPRVWPYDTFLRLWSLKEGQVVRTIAVPEFGADSVVFTPDSRTLIAVFHGLEGRSVRTWDVPSGRPGRSWTDDPALGGTLAVSADGQTLATLNEAGVLRFLDLATGQ
jgi:WD40 repeat protein